MNEYQLIPEEIATFGEIASAVVVLRATQAQRRAELAAEIAALDQQLAATQAQAVGALRTIRLIRGLQGEWSLDHQAGVLRKIEPKPAN